MLRPLPTLLTHRCRALLAALALVLGGCNSIPKGKSSVDDVTVRGAKEVDESEILEKIATTETSKFLGLFRGVLFEYSTFDRFVLQRDLARVEALYRTRGFYDAHARAGRIHVVDAKHVKVEIVVEEGTPVLVRESRVDGIDALPKADADRARKAIAEGLRAERTFTDDDLAKTENALRRSLTDHGYAYAKVKGRASVDLVKHRVDVVFAVRPGPICTFGKITIEGLGELPEHGIRRTVDIEEGAPYSEAALDGAQQALLDLGVLAGVELVPELPGNEDDDETKVGETKDGQPKDGNATKADDDKKGGDGDGDAKDEGTKGDDAKDDAEDGGAPMEPLPGQAAPLDKPAAAPPPPEKAQPTVVPVKVKLEVSRLRTIRLGGGIEFDTLKTDVHGLVGWESKNFFGGLRTFSVSFRPGVVLYPLRFDNLEAPTKPLPEERLRFDFKQPGFLEARTTGFIRPEFNVYPLLLPNLPADARVIGYAETRNAIGLERTFGRLLGTISHNLQVAYPFGYVGKADPTLGLVTISYPELVTTLDLRNDRVHPRSGIFLGNTLQAAGGPFGGMAQDVKIQPEVRAYVPAGKRITFATRASVGFLAARNYGDVARDPQSASLPASEDKTRDYQLTFFRGFFSGGPTQNRGYPIRGIGPYAVVPFLTPDLALAQADAGCVPDAMGAIPARCKSPTGGFSLWEASVEMRILIGGPLSAATFCDASDVSPQTFDVRLDRPHLSCGAGARYDTPVGPVRVDIGYRIPGAQIIPDRPVADEKAPTDLFGIPIAVHIGIGEAY